MRTFIPSLLALVFAGLQPVAAAPAYNWVSKAGGPDPVFAAQIASDAAGNAYVTGEFEGTAQFGSTTLTSSGGRDIYVAKLNASGTVLWARRAGGGSDDFGSGVAVDGAGNVYVTGGFAGTASFGALSVTATGGNDFFVAKYDSAGNVTWVRRGGGSDVNNDFAYGYGVGVDGAGNCYVAGSFYGKATFGSATVTAADYDVFVAKFSSAGAQVWARRSGGTAYDAAYGIAVDSAGNSSITGEFYSNSMSFGAGISVSNGGFDDIFTARYDSAGAPLWAKAGGGKGYDYGYAVAVDTAGNTYMTGGFDGSAAFAPVTLTSSSTSICAVKYGPIGTVIWAKNVVNPGAEAVAGIAVDSSANTYIASGVDTPARRLFVAKLDRNGVPVWTNDAGGANGSIYGRSIGVDRAGNCYPVSEFSGTVSFAGAAYTSASSQDIAVAQIADANGVLQFAASSYAAFENDGNVTLTVNRTGGSSNAVSVAYTTSNDTATAGSDYTAKSGTLSFAAGQKTATITVPILNDATAESPEAFDVAISNPTGGALVGSVASAKVTIYDGKRPTVQWSAATTPVSESAGSVTLTATRTGNTDVTVSAHYATANGSAAAGSDFTGASGLVTIPAGQTTANITIPITNDNATEPNENFSVKLSSPSANCVLGSPSSETVTIADNEPAVVQFAPAAYSFSEASGKATLTVARTGSLSAAASVKFATSAGTATGGGVDFAATTGTVNFAAGQASATINVAIVNDTTPEPNETFKVTLSAATGATIGAKSVATVTIVNDD